MADVVEQLKRCRSSTPGKESRRLMVFDNRDQATREREATYQIARTEGDSSTPRPEPLANVFVRSRSPSGERWLELPRSTRGRHRGRFRMLIPALGEAIASLGFHSLRRFMTVLLLLALGLMLAWYFLR
jgi:hypothetical protein